MEMKGLCKLLQRRDRWKVLLPATWWVHSVLDKKNMKFSTSTHRSEGLLDCVHVSVWGPAKTASLGGHRYFALLLIIYPGIVGYIP